MGLPLLWPGRKGALRRGDKEPQERSRGLTQTELTGIPGFGEKSATKLLSEIGSVKRVRQAPLERIQQVVGKSAGLKVWAYFQKLVVEAEVKSEGEA